MTSVAGNIRTSTPFNEPVRDYRPGSPEATALIGEIDRVRGRDQAGRSQGGASERFPSS